MLHTKTKRLEMCIDINTEISEVDYYTWIFTSRIFRLVTCNCNRLVILLISIFSCKWLTSSSHKVENFKSGGGGARFPNKSEGGGEILGNFFKKISWERDAYYGPRVSILYTICIFTCSKDILFR